MIKEKLDIRMPWWVSSRTYRPIVCLLQQRGYTREGIFFLFSQPAAITGNLSRFIGFEEKISLLRQVNVTQYNKRDTLAVPFILFIFYTLFCSLSQNELGLQDAPFVVLSHIGSITHVVRLWCSTFHHQSQIDNKHDNKFSQNTTKDLIQQYYTNTSGFINTLNIDKPIAKIDPI